MMRHVTHKIVVLFAVLTVSVAANAQVCPPDFTGDGEVNVTDLINLLAVWGTNDPYYDVQQDGNVNLLDLLAVLAAWGPCRPTVLAPCPGLPNCPELKDACWCGFCVEEVMGPDCPFTEGDLICICCQVGGFQVCKGGLYAIEGIDCTFIATPVGADGCVNCLSPGSAYCNLIP